MSRLKRLIHEIHRRSLWQVLMIYCGGAWVCYEIIDTITGRLALPDWLPVLAIILFLIGLPVVVATALVGEVEAPSPAPSEAEVAAAQVETRRTYRFLTWRNAAATFVIVLAAWGVVATGWMLFGRGPDEGAPADERPSIAVLPLENRSGLEDDRYFTDGIHDEILTQLSKISGLSVRARTSVMEYRDSPKGIRQIGEELDARYVMEGGVQRAGGTVRINVQLIDAESDDHVFAETYDREMSLENLLAVQREVALRIADVLESTLTAEERERIEKVPTENPEAYDFYLRGIEYMGRLTAEGTRYAQWMLERAVELDPGFALAYAELSQLHTSAYWFASDRSEERARRSREAAERALLIDPDLPEGHLALGRYYYHVQRDYDRALEELAIAERALPGDPRPLDWRGVIWRRQGKWEQALASLQRALTLNPRAPGLLYELGWTYLSLRRYDEAEGHFDRYASLQPEFGALLKALVPLYERGNTEPLRKAFARTPLGLDLFGGDIITVLRAYAKYYGRQYAAALEVLSSSELEYFDWGDFGPISAPRTLLTGTFYTAMGDTGRARAAADSALRDLEVRLREQPDDPRLHVSSSQAHALLGQEQEAIGAAQRAVDLMPISDDAVHGPDYVRNLATIYAWFGEVDAAVAQFDRYLAVPAPGSVEFILLDPGIDPIRDDPRFQALVDKYE